MQGQGCSVVVERRLRMVPSFRTLAGSESGKLVIYLACAKAILIAASYFSNPAANPIEFLANWDFVHFQSIAQNGYVQITDYAFAPLYPALLRLLTMVGLPSWGAGFALTNTFSFLFPLILKKVYGFRVALLAELFPIYLVYGLVPYSDMLTLTFLVLAVYLLSKKGRPFRAAIAFSLAVVNAYAIVWVLPSLIFAFVKRGGGRRGRSLTWRSSTCR